MIYIDPPYNTGLTVAGIIKSFKGFGIDFEIEIGKFDG